MDNDRVKMVKEASDIVDVIGSYISLRPAGQQTFKGLCPFMMITGLLLMSTLKEDATGVGLVANMGM